MNSDHKFDVNFWCVICGAGLEDIMKGSRSEVCNKEVVGISHIVRSLKLKSVVENFRV